MRAAAPPVQAWSCNSGPWRVLQLFVQALGVAVLAGWMLMHLCSDAGVAVLGAAAAGLLGLGLASRRPAGEPSRLAWDGAAWTLQPPRGDALAGQARVMIDLGHWMLVRFTPAGRWLPLGRAGAADWQALRVALHAVPPTRPQG